MKNVLNGKEFKEMFSAATEWLEKIVPDINALNVYPVPDGDCGTNMLFTMKASLAEARNANGSVSSVARAMAKGALMGARGNSGVILSQIWRGISAALNNHSTVDGKGWADALTEACRTAYHALSNPVEGTILTVIKDTASAAQKATSFTNNIEEVLEHSVNAARVSVSETPKLLSILEEAGVVDAGGHGLFTLLEGALLFLKGEIYKHSPRLVVEPTKKVTTVRPEGTEEEAYGFCTQFMLQGKNLNIDTIRENLQDKGKSLIVVGDSNTVRVHIHTLHPDIVTDIMSEFGNLFDIDIRNMDEQHKDFLLMHESRAEIKDVAIVAVVNGTGLARVFFDLGVAAIVPGGQSMNPSTMDLLQAVEAVTPQNVIILPNNKNIILTAGQVQNLTKKRVVVVPSENIPQGISALVSFIPDLDIETNLNQMKEACTTVRTIEITRATRSTRLNGLEITEGSPIGLLDGKLVSSGESDSQVIMDILSLLDMSRMSIVTLYYGEGISLEQAENIKTQIGQQYPNVEIELIEGGQPFYSFIISVE